MKKEIGHNQSIQPIATRRLIFSLELDNEI